MERELHVYADLKSSAILVGRLWVRERQGRETATFQYVPSWLAHPDRFALSPSLPLSAGQFQSAGGLFNAFTDSAPDRWGQKLMRHHERNRAKTAGTTPRTLLGIDFLAGVEDQTRMGALRFKAPGDEQFLSQNGTPVPPLIELGALLSATDRIEKGKERTTDIALILAPGGSLGGARPKATVRDRDGRLHLAKFPWINDDWPVIQWEATTLALAKVAGVQIPDFRVEKIGRKTVLMISRFDREMDQRLPFMSAFTALDAKDHEEDRSYLELVDALRQLGNAPLADLHQLWRRMVFNVLVSNTDDHPRNHGFLRNAGGWRLAPAYDMNPSPLDVSGRIHVLALNELDRTGSLETVLSVHDYFALSLKEAKKIAGEVGGAVSKWRSVAKDFGLTKDQIGRMETAFEHEDLRLAVANVTSAARPRTPRVGASGANDTPTKTSASKATLKKARATGPAKKKTVA